MHVFLFYFIFRHTHTLTYTFTLTNRVYLCMCVYSNSPPYHTLFSFYPCKQKARKRGRVEQCPFPSYTRAYIKYICTNVWYLFCSISLEHVLVHKLMYECGICIDLNALYPRSLTLVGQCLVVTSCKMLLISHMYTVQYMLMHIAHHSPTSHIESYIFYVGCSER